MTMAKLSGLLAGVLATLALAAPARAEQPGQPHTYVVLIGIGKYQDPQIKPRPFAEDDAKALYQLLTDKKYLGVPADNVKLLLGAPDPAVKGSEKATRENILKALTWVGEQARPRDLVIIGYFGEGGPLGKSGDRRCYFAVDSTFANRDKDAVAADDIGEALKKLKAEHVCSFVDVNFKGFDPKDQKVPEPNLGTAPYKEFIGDDETDEHAPLTGHVVFLATNGLSSSLDLKEKGHGIFAEVLLDGLKGGADGADKVEGNEADGFVTVDELTAYLDKQLPELARKFGGTKEEKQQHVFVLGGEGTHYVLTTNPDKVVASIRNIEKFEGLVKSGKVPEKFAAEGTLLLGRMPRLEAQRNLRKEYQKLADGAISLDTFEANRTKILDSTKMTDREAAAWADKLIRATRIIRENYVKDLKQGELVAWAVRGLYRAVEEKVPEELDKKLKEAVNEDDEGKLRAVAAEGRKLLGHREDLDKSKDHLHRDLDLALKRMCRHLDPYTTYIDPEEKQRFDADIGGQFTGIGIQIRKDAATDYLLVVSPIKNSPAYKGGLQAGDLVTQVIRPVDSEGRPINPPQVLETKGLPLNDAVKNILGKEDTPIKLIVQREGVDKPLEIELRRARIEVESVLGIKRKADDSWDYMIDPQSKIGYVRLTSFSRNSFRDLDEVVKDLRQQGMKGFILDLRFDPGGLLTAAWKISDLFLPDKAKIVEIRPRVGASTWFRGQPKTVQMTDFPMVVLVNGYSASASEIVSAALQDNGRAVVVGERSYGKGSVQNIYENFEGGDLKFTTATFWRPSGKNLNKATAGKNGGPGNDDDVWGVTPDRVVKLERKEREDLAEHQHELEVIRPKGKPMKDTGFEDRQLNDALKYLREQIKTASR